MRNRGLFGGTTYGPGASLRHLLRLLVRRSKPTVAHRCYTEIMKYLQPLRPCLIPFHAVKSKWERPHCLVCELFSHAQQVCGCLPASMGERGTQSLEVHTFIFATYRFLRSQAIPPQMLIIFAFNCPFFVRRGLSGLISGLVQQCKVFSYSFCLLLLLQLWVVASVGEITRSALYMVIGWPGTRRG